MRLDTKLTLRFGENVRPAAEWASKNIVLLLGEFGIESDTGQIKIGDGSRPWNQLEYLRHKGTPYKAGEGVVIADNGTINTQLTYDVV